MLTRNADFYIRIKTVNGKLYESGIEPYWQLEYTRTNGGEFIGIGYQNVIILPPARRLFLPRTLMLVKKYKSNNAIRSAKPPRQTINNVLNALFQSV